MNLRKEARLHDFMLSNIKSKNLEGAQMTQWQCLWSCSSEEDPLHKIYIVPYVKFRF